MIVIYDFARFIEYKFENEASETSYGEPQIWIGFESGRCVEITHEQYGLSEEDWYYSLRYHCTKEEFDNDKYHETVGVIDSWCCDGTIDLANHLSLITDRYSECISDEELKQFDEWDI